jgi:hypothetical protein
VPDPSWFNNLQDDPKRGTYTRPHAKPGEHEGCFVYSGNSEEPFMKAYEAAGWELETRIPCQLGVRLQFKAKSG